MTPLPAETVFTVLVKRWALSLCLGCGDVERPKTKKDKLYGAYLCPDCIGRLEPGIARLISHFAVSPLRSLFRSSRDPCSRSSSDDPPSPPSPKDDPNP
jgi:uncharacterized protein YlaI